LAAVIGQSIGPGPVVGRRRALQQFVQAADL
jgi:hypothetical protein